MNKILDYVKGIAERAVEWVTRQVPKAPIPVPVRVKRSRGER